MLVDEPKPNQGMTRQNLIKNDHQILLMLPFSDKVVNVDTDMAAYPEMGDIDALLQVPKELYEQYPCDG